MQPVYIDCHGFNQFHKIVNALHDLNFGKDVCKIDCQKVYDKPKCYDLYTVQVLPADPMFAGSHCHLHEYLMDVLPIKARFITCMDYEEIFQDDYKPFYKS